MIRNIVIFDVSKFDVAFERALESEIIGLSRHAETVRRFALGRNVHPMRPDLWMCTHVWELEFDDVGAHRRFWSAPSVDDLVGRCFSALSHELRSASIAYAVVNGSAGGDLMLPGRIRRLHLANFVVTASDLMKRAGDNTLLSMPHAIPQIRAWALGYQIDADVPTIARFEHSWDTSFDTVADLQEYVTCDYHRSEAHEFAAAGAKKKIFRDLQSCLYKIDPEMSSGRGY